MLIKYIKSVHWRVAKCLSYIEDARCLKVKELFVILPSALQSVHENLLTDSYFATHVDAATVWTVTVITITSGYAHNKPLFQSGARGRGWGDTRYKCDA